jgi:N-acetylglutamate synthase-like GNAT family acetyltransferase
MTDITLRTATPADKPAVVALAAKIWDGEDYLGQRFDKWVADEHGRFTVAYSGQTLVGCGKLTRFSPGEWWLEGLRVDPDWRGQGIAHILHHNVIEFATAEKLTGHLRLATAAENLAVHKMSLDTGFERISTHILYKASLPAEPLPPAPFTRVETAEKSDLSDWLNRSATFAACHGLFEESWKWYEIVPRLDELLGDGRFYWWRKGQADAGLVLINHRDPDTLVLNYLDSPTNDYVPLFDDVRQLAQTYKVEIIESKPLALDEIKEALLQTQWEIDYDLEMWVFERPLR